MAAAFWNANAERYARKSVVNPGAFERKIDVTKSLMPRSVVPDIGCGTGSLALRLAPFCSPRPWARCSQRDDPHRERQDARPEDRKRDLLHRFVRRQLHRVRRRKSRWNLRVQLLHLFEDRPAALAWVDRLLKPGSFLVSVHCLPGEIAYPLRRRASPDALAWKGTAGEGLLQTRHRRGNSPGGLCRSRTAGRGG